MKAVLFDLDGTLLWTDGAGRRAIHRALLEVLAIERPAASFRFDGRTDPEIVELLAAAAGRDHGPDTVAGVLKAYVRLLDLELSRPGQRTTVYPGVLALLDALERRSDCVLGLLTGNVVEGARLKLARGGLDRFFDWGASAVCGFAGDGEDREHVVRAALRRASDRLGRAVAPGEALVIGDTPRDVAAAHAVGIPVLGVATGRYGEAELRQAGADHVAPSLADTGALRILLG